LRETLHIAFKKCMCQIEAFKHTLGRGKFIYKSKHTLMISPCRFTCLQDMKSH